MERASATHGPVFVVPGPVFTTGLFYASPADLPGRGATRAWRYPGVALRGQAVLRGQLS